MKKNQRGFGLLGVVVIIVVIGVIVAAAWYVYKKNNDKKENNTSSSTSQQVKEPAPSNEAKDETANWKEVKNSTFGFSYKYPNETGWEDTVNATASDSAAYVQGERINSASVKYTLCGKNCGLVFDLRVFVKGSQADVGSNWAEESMSRNAAYKLQAKESITQDGVSGTKWVYAPQGEYEGTVAKIAYYYFTKGNLSYAMQANYNGAVTDKLDITAYGEKVASTFRFTQ